jgi:O-acetyl-ADP-ribose deacetylase (regulator of RNase III)
MINFEDYKNKIELNPYSRPIYLKEKEREEIIDALIDFLFKERCEITPLVKLYNEKRQLLRSLMNIRQPKIMPNNLIELQDKVLWSETLDKDIVNEDQIRFFDGIALWHGDITRLEVDAIVNAANSKLLGCFQPLHSCIDNVIHSAGGIQIREDCAKIIELQKTSEPTGTAKITRAYNLPSKYILHTVGPRVTEKVTDKEKAELKSCYTSCLELAQKAELTTIAFCCISTGVFGYPNHDACKIAVKTVKEWLAENTNIKVIFNVFLNEDKKLYEQELQDKN